MLRNLPILFNNILSINQARQAVRPLFISATNEAARKGTREKARKKKVKVEIKKIGFIPHNLRKKLVLNKIKDQQPS
jgi:hypothetical protein